MSFFEAGEQPTSTDRSPFIFRAPDLTHVKATPAFLSEWPADTDISEAECGAGWLGLPLFPQGVQVASVMSAVKPSPVAASGVVPLYRHVVIEMARRSTKTTAALAVLLGRCLQRPGYTVASIAQTGVKAREKLLEVQAAVRAAGFERNGFGTCLQGMGDTRINFTNGSMWKALPPDPAAFRSAAYDAVLIDEAGELDPDKAQLLLAGILPTLDTRPTAQVIVAGTPGETRAGLLWTRLEQLRSGRPNFGGVVYEAPDRSAFLDRETGAPDWELLARVHPGIGTLTDAQTIVDSLEDMGLDRWQREYLCLWPRNAAASALDVDAWEDCLAAGGLPPRPDRVGLAWEIDPDGRRAALVAAWRDADDIAHLEVLGCEAGSDWLPRTVRAAEEKHRCQSVYDPIGQNLEAAERMRRAPFRSRTQPLKLRDQVGAAARIDKLITQRRIVQYGQADLDEAVRGAVWRPAGTDGRLFSRKASTASVACLVAAAAALWAYDTATPARSGPRRIRVATSA